MFIRESRMAPWPAALAGRLEKVTVASELLRGNPLGDPHERPLWVYLPPGYPDQARRFPSVYLLPGYGGSVASWARGSAEISSANPLRVTVMSSASPASPCGTTRTRRG